MKKALLEGGQGNIIGKIRGAAVIRIVQNAKDDSNTQETCSAFHRLRLFPCHHKDLRICRI